MRASLEASLVRGLPCHSRMKRNSSDLFSSPADRSELDAIAGQIEALALWVHENLMSSNEGHGSEPRVSRRREAQERTASVA